MSAGPVLIGDLVRRKRVIVCCGAGGVGKTTTAAALALSAARAGRKVLVLTIDPSRRLAETLGVSRNPPHPVPIPADRAAQAGVVPPGSVDAWMIDPKLVADESVRRLVRSPADAERVLGNRIYQQVSAMVAGMHEYTAMEALHRFVVEGRYELVVLDTPPSRHALDFLEAPRRLKRLVEGRALQAFLPRSDSRLARAASSVIQRILAGVFGADFAEELVTFLNLFSSIFSALNVDVNAMRAFLGSDDVAFLLITSPAASTLAEAHFFLDKTRELGLPFRAFVLNRSRALDSGRVFPEPTLLGDAPSPALLKALEKLRRFAHIEREAERRDRALVAELRQKAGPLATAVALPDMPHGPDDMRLLVSLADLLAAC